MVSEKTEGQYKKRLRDNIHDLSKTTSVVNAVMVQCFIHHFHTILNMRNHKGIDLNQMVLKKKKKKKNRDLLMTMQFVCLFIIEIG